MTGNEERIRVETTAGIVEGFFEDGLDTFLGVPYAAAGRFEKPQPAAWTGVFDASRMGKMAMQPHDEPQDGGSVSGKEYGEDCQNLNIYTPGCGGCLPVVVYIHGGAFQNGSNQSRSGRQMIRNRSFVYVAVNYRLGALGYLYLGDALGDKWRHTGNLGTMDQLAALRWIHENIRAFGGDPSRVTVMGESAGAKSIGALLLRPEMQEYCSQVLLASGATQSIRDTHTAEAVTECFLDAARGQGLKDPAELLSMDAGKIMEIQRSICRGFGSTCLFGPVADGLVFPEDWRTRIKDGVAWRGRALIGSCRNELGFYRMNPHFLREAENIAGEFFGRNAPVAIADFAAFLETHPDADEEKQADFWVRILSDYMYRAYSLRLAVRMARQGSTVWVYSMEYGRAFHCLDQNLAFDRSINASMTGAASEEEWEAVADCIYEAYANFFTCGDPNGAGAEDRKPPFPAWPPLSVGQEKYMRWQAAPDIRELSDYRALDHFPDDVYRR